jgi:hypothetical protein
LLPLLQENNSPPINGLTVNILSPGVPQLMMSRKVSNLDITDLVNGLIGDSDIYINSQNLQITFLNTLFNSQYVNKLTVVPGRLSVGFPESKFKSSKGSLAWIRNINTSVGLSGREIIMQAEGQWYHTLWSTKHEVESPEDSDIDFYSKYDIFNLEVVPVKLMIQRGFMVLATKYSNSVLQILCQNTLETSKITLFGDMNLEDDDKLIELLALEAEKGRAPEIMIEYYQRQENLIIEEDDDVSSHDSDNMLEEQLNASDSDSEGYGSLLSDLLDSLPSVSSASSESVKTPSDHASEGYSAPLSAQSSIRQPEGVIVNLAYSSIMKAPRNFIDRVNKKYKSRFQSAYHIMLPVEIASNAFKSDENGSCWEKLFKMIDDLDELDRIWLREYVITSMLNFAAIRDRLNMKLDETDKVEDEDIDFDFS